MIPFTSWRPVVLKEKQYILWQHENFIGGKFQVMDTGLETLRRDSRNINYGSAIRYDEKGTNLGSSIK